jgi:Sulfotransferase domain
MKQEADELTRRGADVYQVQYDDLVGEPEKTLGSICEFIGIPFDPKMTSLEGADRSAVYNGEHHSMVKSSSIVAKRERPEVLSPALKSKVERYVVFWRTQSGGQWPVKAAVTEGTPPASLMERTVDRLRHRLFRTKDLIVPFAYAAIPVPLWRRYRQMKSRYQRVAPEPGESKAV